MLVCFNVFFAVFIPSKILYNALISSDKVKNISFLRETAFVAFRELFDDELVGLGSTCQWFNLSGIPLNRENEGKEKGKLDWQKLLTSVFAVVILGSLSNADSLRSRASFKS